FACPPAFPVEAPRAYSTASPGRKPRISRNPPWRGLGSLWVIRQCSILPRMHARTEILLVTADDALDAEVREALGPQGTAVRTVRSPAALEAELAGALERNEFLLVLLDGELGDDVVFQACKSIRSGASGREVGILALLSRPEDQTLVGLLGAGADDVVSRRIKPFGFRARLTSHLRRLESAAALTRKVRDSALLIRVTSHLVGVGDLFQNLFEMVRLLAAELDVTRSSVVLVRPEGDYGLVLASSDDSALRSLPLDLSRYPEIQRVVREQQPLVVPDVTRSDLLEAVQSELREAHVTSVALFPILRDGATIGVIFLRFARPRDAFAERELVFCQTVANATAIALRNAEIKKLLEAKTCEVEQVRTEARTQVAALARYRDFFDSSVDGMVVLSAAGVVLFANPRGADLLGCGEQRATGLPLATCLRPEDRSRLEQLLDAGARGANQRACDFQPDGEEADRVISISAGPLEDEGMLLLTIRDVTRERGMAAQLADAQERLMESEKKSLMMEIAGAAAHELNQPLTSVLTTAAMLRRVMTGDAEQTARLVETLEQEAERMAAIIRRFAKLTEYSTKPYVGRARIIDLERASGENALEKEQP
ncbi:MAG TPA: PAS domain-containing protein, partial [Polyangia bacterium]|nr:PAS domain-containing protein [Polyangia bacterium]